jgi:ABC-2 type transport system ATP-binding protein
MMVEIKGVSVQFPKVLAVNAVSCIFNQGLIHGLIGPNGAGKSSLLKAMVGLISNYSGQIFYDSLLLQENRPAIKKQVGYAPEDIELIPYLSGLEYLQMIGDIRKIDDATARITYLLQLLGLQDVQDKIIDGYSHGMRQKVSLAAALLGFPPFYILDEALNGLDSLALINVKKLLQELAGKGHTVILSSHILELVEQWCDTISIMLNGRLIVQLTKEQLTEIIKKHEEGLTGYFQKLVMEAQSHLKGALHP